MNYGTYHLVYQGITLNFRSSFFSKVVWYSERCKYWMQLWVDSRLAPSQRKTSLQSNVASHWLGANLESALQLQRLEESSWKLHSLLIFIPMYHQVSAFTGTMMSWYGDVCALLVLCEENPPVTGGFSPLGLCNPNWFSPSKLLNKYSSGRSSKMPRRLCAVIVMAQYILNGPRVTLCPQSLLISGGAEMIMCMFTGSTQIPHAP